MKTVKRNLLEKVPALTLRARASKAEVMLYQPVSGDIVARWPWHYSNAPRPGQKSCTLNGVKRPLIWHGRPVQLELF